jgi:cell wall-associated NlpC family hydrolase
VTTLSRPGRWARAAVTVLTAVAIVTTGSGLAAADPITDARARAAALAATVRTLQTRAEVAIERYDAVEARLGQAVTQRMLAQRAVDAAQETAGQHAAVSEDRVRALYEAGGPTSLLATVLDGSNLTDALARYHDVTVVLGTDRLTARRDDARVVAAQQLETQLATAANTVTRLQVEATRAATTVRSLLDAQQHALTAADADVRRLVAQAQAAALARSAASFAQAVQAAGGTVDAGMTPPNDVVAHMLAVAKSKLGDAYVWGATGPDTFDCSGLTQFAYAAAGIALPRVAADQWGVGAKVALSDLEPGDLLFWATDPARPATIHHVAIYLGDGMMLAAPHTGDVVKVQPVYMDGFIGATRPWQPA